jgi:class 3 adenylate cyclase/pimeloyl-ACP methyl ester carboxylesterase
LLCDDRGADNRSLLVVVDRLSAMADVPETRFTRVGQDRVAFQVFGRGTVDLVAIPSLTQTIDTMRESPAGARLLDRLGSFARVITFDRRGMGASDRVSEAAQSSWEEWAADAGAVMDAVGSARAAVMGLFESGPHAIFFAATHPDRVEALVLAMTGARFLIDTDYPWGVTAAELDAVTAVLEDVWGTEAMPAFPGATLEERRLLAKSARSACSPRDAATFLRRAQLADVRALLPSLRVPTLVLQSDRHQDLPVEMGRYLAEHIPGAEFVLVEGAESDLFEVAVFSDHIERLLTGATTAPAPDRALAAVLFSDIVGSTQQAVAMGDRQWRDLLARHDQACATIIAEHRGRLIKRTGDGVVVIFDGPGRAIRCAFALRDALESIGIHIRAGLHAGEIELRAEDIAGIAVHIAARVVALAAAGEVVVSGAVPPLVAGSGIEFDDRGEHVLKGVPGTWKLFAVHI